MTLPTLAMVSTDIRRDLVAPLRHVTRLRLLHFYRHAPYGDLAPEEIDETLIAYNTPLDLLRRLSRAQPTIVQGVEPFAVRLLPYLYAVFAIALWQRIPLILVALENRPLAEKHGPVLSPLLRAILRPVFSRARLIIYLNEGARRNVLSIGPYEAKLQRLAYGAWGVDLAEFTPQRDGREAAFGPGPVLLFVGRLHQEKGVFDLLAAYERVHAAHPSAILILAGDGPARPEIERIVAQRGWAGAVRLLGMVKNRDLPPIFRAADVFVAPSVTTRKWEEQVGMTNIQAMACGVPVVSTRSGAIPEYVPDGVAGVLVPERDPAALAGAINRLLADDDLRRQMGEGGRAYACAHYDAAANIAIAEQVLLEVAGSH
ncbi:MAG: glycosyltransferase family 4 protein [Anaerolineae bacterium]|nr:glycosyltransferase family 4 protein [Anaerolineae bacterium]